MKIKFCIEEHYKGDSLRTHYIYETMTEEDVCEIISEWWDKKYSLKECDKWTTSTIDGFSSY